MKRFCALKIFVLLIIFSAVSQALAQDEPIRVDTNIVTVNVAVTDDKGKFVSGMTQKQFEIFDNGVKRNIEYFSAQEAPVTYGIVYDMHPTTRERTQAVLESLKAFTGALRQADDFFIVAFSERGSLSLDFIPTVEQVENQISPAAKRDQPTALYDAIYAAAAKLRSDRNLKRTLLVISDSADHQSRHSFPDVLKTLKNFDVQVYAVILDSESKWKYSDVTVSGKNRKPATRDANAYDRASLSDLTLKSGGTSHFPVSESARELFDIYSEISSDLRERYTISFTPDAADGKWHDLRVKLSGAGGNKKFALTYRLGYQSPPPKN
jgi:Ca-activated chloride channel family protein